MSRSTRNQIKGMLGVAIVTNPAVDQRTLRNYTTTKPRNRPLTEKDDQSKLEFITLPFFIKDEWKAVGQFDDGCDLLMLNPMIILEFEPFYHQEIWSLIGNNMIARQFIIDYMHTLGPNSHYFGATSKKQQQQQQAEVYISNLFERRLKIGLKHDVSTASNKNGSMHYGVFIPQKIFDQTLSPYFNAMKISMIYKGNYIHMDLGKEFVKKFIKDCMISKDPSGGGTLLIFDDDNDKIKISYNKTKQTLILDISTNVY